MTELEIDVKNTLREAASEPICFQIGGVHIRQRLLTRVATAIEDSRIHVTFVRRLADRGICLYDPLANVMETGFARVNTIMRKAIVVHEAVHAACDMSKAKRMRTVTSEAVGYIAQIIFALGKLPPGMEVSSDNPEVQGIIEEATPLARRVIAHPGIDFDDSDLTLLRNAILACSLPEYSELTADVQCTDFNGI